MIDSSRLKVTAHVHQLCSTVMPVPKSVRWTVPEPPPPVSAELKFFGVLFTNDLSVTSHIISKCSSSTYALLILRANSLQNNTLFTVCNATTISRLLLYIYMPPRHGVIAPVLRTGNGSTNFFEKYIGRDIHQGQHRRPYKTAAGEITGVFSH